MSVVLLATVTGSLPGPIGAPAAHATHNTSAGIWDGRVSAYRAAQGACGTGFAVFATARVTNSSMGTWRQWVGVTMNTGSGTTGITIVVGDGTAAGGSWASIGSGRFEATGYGCVNSAYTFASWNLTFTGIRTSASAKIPWYASGSAVNDYSSQMVTWCGASSCNPGTPAADGSSQSFPAALPDTQLTCDRVLSTFEGSKIADFDVAVTNTTTGTAYAWEWDFGDGTTSTTQNPQHTYSGAQPDGGWTATATVTATGDDLNYTGTDESSCGMRIDFLNPTQTTPSSTTKDEADDADCPAGWGWLNPLAITKILKCLFLPTENAGGEIDDLKASYESSILGSATKPVVEVFEGYDSLQDGYHYIVDFDPVFGTDRRTYPDACTGPTLNLELPSLEDPVALQPLNNCAGVSQVLAGIFSLIFKLVFWVGTAIAAGVILAGSLGFKIGDKGGTES